MSTDVPPLSAFRFDVIPSAMKVARGIITLLHKADGSESDTLLPADADADAAADADIAAAAAASVQLNALSAIRKQKSAFVVFANALTKARGTGGRSWSAPGGNLMMSLSIPTESIPVVLLPILPLLVGVSARSALLAYVRNGAGERSSSSALQYEALSTGLTVKWPNDLLLSGRKLMGTLIEHDERGHFVIGMGMNVGTAPVIDTSDGSRETACLREVLGDGWVNREGGSGDLAGEATTSVQPPPSNSSAPTDTALMSKWTDVAVAIGTMICTELLNRIAKANCAPSRTEERLCVIREFDAHMARDIVLRKRVGGGARGPEVVPLGLNEWGHLRVRCISSSKEEVLVADYLN